MLSEDSPLCFYECNDTRTSSKGLPEFGVSPKQRTPHDHGNTAATNYP
jgi:hypothetical protein